MEWLSPTRLTGLIAYSTGAAACLVRWSNCRGGGVSGRPFAILAGAQLALLLDMTFDLRWKLHGFLVSEAIQHGVYERRHLPQLLALAALMVGLEAALVALFFRFRRRAGIALALMGTLLSLVLWVAEWISYHYVDWFFYHMFGKVMAVSVLWIGFAVVTCYGVWLDGRRGIPAGTTGLQ